MSFERKKNKAKQKLQSTVNHENISNGSVLRCVCDSLFDMNALKSLNRESERENRWCKKKTCLSVTNLF